MFLVEFINQLKENKYINIDEIKNEEPNIIIFCNKILFKIKKQKAIGDKISNKKLLKLIQNDLIR